MDAAVEMIILGGTSSASGSTPVVPTGTGTMDFSLVGGDNTGLLALLDDF